MYNIINTKTGKTIIQVSAYKWEQDSMWQNRITNHLTAAGFKFKVEKA
jgi:hypothetical protein